ncbi:MAG: hypothetical protein NT012_00285 [Candidatus Nealsonbacteria bacterium]|nr:hypothetical protein [Candidatus Nealsonbacteria bacterium]
MKKTIIITLILALLLIPRTSVLASTTDLEIQILKIRIQILELQIQRLLILLNEIQLSKIETNEITEKAVIEDSPEIKPESKSEIEIPAPQKRAQDCLLRHPGQPQYCNFSGAQE